jgi:transcriptional regulator with XRE-family HTH domain
LDSSVMTTALTPPVSGIDLLVCRKQLGLRQQDVADAMGVVRSRVAHLEAMYRPPTHAVERYMAALSEARRAA